MEMEYKLMDQLGKVQRGLNRLLAYYTQESNPTTLTPVQVVVLQYIIVQSRVRDVYSRDLETFFDIKSSSVTSMVNYLEKAGYISRESVPEDGRLRKLVITEKTREIEDWVCGAIDRYIRAPFADFRPEEMEALSVLLDRLLENV